jgi:hypothetical protein
MKNPILFIAIVSWMTSLSFSILAADREGIAPQNEFAAFWSKFKSAVVNSDKAAVAELTSFPFSIYASHLKNRTDFLRRYDEIFNGEANAAQCFRDAKPRKESERYEIYCPFKETPNDKENAPIRFVFERTKSGWKFAGLDNINE